MDIRFKAEKVNWKTKSEYVDIDTGEQLTKEEVIKQYIIIKKRKHSEKYKSTGVTTITNECRRTNQGKLFD